MHSIRDSIEPEDSFGNDIIQVCPDPPPIDASPITFDLPSTTSAPHSTTVQTQLTSGQRNHHSHDCIPVATGDIWDLPTNSSVFSKQTGEIDESPLVVRTRGRRNSMSAMDMQSTPPRTDRASSVDLEESPAIRRKRRRLAHLIDDSDDDGKVEQKKAKGSREDPIEVQVDELLGVGTSLRKRFVAVEIPSKMQPKAKAKRGRAKKPLDEIVVAQNIASVDVERTMAPIPSPTKSAPSRRQTPPPPTTDITNADNEDLENVVFTKVPAKPAELRPPEPIDKTAPTMSPVRPKNVASILAKSPNRPFYRVGLSRRVNVEPLHGYLKRTS
jgi:hypothetical protein